MKDKHTIPRVAYLGPEGTFSGQAAKKFFGQNAIYKSLSSIQDVFEAVDLKEILYGVVPVENSIEGSVNVTLDLLRMSNLKIYGEIEEKIKHNLIASPGTKKHDLKVVISHQQALAQCRKYLKEQFPRVKVKQTDSTALAVRKVRTLKYAAAIGTEFAAKVYGMKIVAREIGDYSNNFTRFFVLSSNDFKPTGNDKTSIMFSAKHVPGALFKALEPFASRNINLSKIESRPLRQKPWEYVFFVEFKGHRRDSKCKEALQSLKKNCEFLKVLGSYRRAI